MDFLNARRKITTYGKTTRKPLVHKFFDDTIKQDSAPPGASNATAPTIGLSDDPLPDPMAPNLENHARAVQDPKPYSLPPSRVGALSDRTKKARSSAREDSDRSLFEIATSDEDASHIKTSVSAKKRAVHSLRAAKDKTSNLSTTTAQRPKEARSNPANVQLPRLKQDRSEKSLIAAISMRTNTGLPAPLQTSRKPNAQVSTIEPSISRGKIQLRNQAQQKNVTEDDATDNNDTSPDTSGHLTDTSLYSISSSQTPKRKRPLSHHSDASTPSPTSLGIKMLRLTPERSKLPRSAQLDAKADDDDETPRRRVRSRLIDRLDAPDVNPGGADDHDTLIDDLPSGGAGARGSMQGTAQRTRENGEPPALQVERSENSQSRATYATKSRTTYAKERSHLTDMVDNIDALGGPSSSQHSSHAALLVNSASDLASQLELEEEGDNDSDGPGRLKSIHELRQAGANNRFDRELHAILEDIDMHGTSNKSLRVQALMRLFRRFEDTTFLQHVANSTRAGRLIACDSCFTDDVSALLMTLCLYLLATADAPARNMPSIFTTVLKLSPRLLTTDTAFSLQIKGRSQNLSKSTIRDLQKFEKFALSQLGFVSDDKMNLYPSEVALATLDFALRGALRDPGSGVKISSSIYNDVFDLLQRRAELLSTTTSPGQTDLDSHKALQLLEACSIATDGTELEISDSTYECLGDSLAKIMDCTTSDHDGIHQDILRVVVSLSNNNKGICRAFAQSPILDLIFSVVDDHFLTVARQAELEQAINRDKLNSVILALGSLLNIAESDDQARSRLSTSGPSRSLYTISLVAMFNSQVSKYQEVTTEDQTQVMVAFGYLSMLLCTLSLDLSLRHQITRLLDGTSFTDLCMAAETFFQHLRTLDQLSDGSETMSNFTKRFNTILETIRGP